MICLMSNQMSVVNTLHRHSTLHSIWTLEKWVKSAAKWISFKNTLRERTCTRQIHFEREKGIKMKSTLGSSKVGGFRFQKNDKHVRYLRGVKSSYLLNVGPSQRRVITFDFAHKNTPTNICQKPTNTKWKPTTTNVYCNAAKFLMQFKIRLGPLE